LELLDLVLVGLSRNNRRRQGGLAVVDVTDGADVDVRLGALEDFLSHRSSAASWRPRDAPEARRVPVRDTGCKDPESCCWDLNPGPGPYQGRPLPAELQQHDPRRPPPDRGEGERARRFKPPTSCLEGRSSTIELRPRPAKDKLGRAKGKSSPAPPDS